MPVRSLSTVKPRLSVTPCNRGGYPPRPAPAETATYAVSGPSGKRPYQLLGCGTIDRADRANLRYDRGSGAQKSMRCACVPSGQACRRRQGAAVSRDPGHQAAGGRMDRWTPWLLAASALRMSRREMLGGTPGCGTADGAARRRQGHSDRLTAGSSRARVSASSLRGFRAEREALAASRSASSDTKRLYSGSHSSHRAASVPRPALCRVAAAQDGRLLHAVSASTIGPAVCLRLVLPRRACCCWGRAGAG